MVTEAAQPSLKMVLRKWSLPALCCQIAFIIIFILVIIFNKKVKDENINLENK